MTLDQILAFAVLGLMMAAFLWGRYRYDLIALCALLVAIGVGIVPYDQAFSGFSDDIVIIVGSALIVSAGVARSGLMEAVIERFVPSLSGVRWQILFLVSVVTILSAFIKNVGALAIMIPIAFQFARRSRVSASVFLMPMAFGALIGGLMTQIGTSPNIVVSRIRQEMVGTSFTMFDFTPVGATLAIAGIIYLTFFSWLVPQRKREGISVNEAIDIKNYASEAKVTKNSNLIGKLISDLIKPAEGEAMVTAIVRDGRRVTPLPDTQLCEGDIILLEGGPKALEAVVNKGKLQLTDDRTPENPNGETEIEAVEAVVSKGSPLIGLSARSLDMYSRYSVNLLAVSRADERLKGRLGEVVFRFGDVLMLQGRSDTLPTILQEFGCMPLAKRTIMLGSVRRGVFALFILIAAIILTAFSILPVAIAFFSAAVAMIAFRVIPMNELYSSMDGPILVMLAALIPVSDALRTTGGTDLIANWLSILGHNLPPAGALAMIMIAAMVVTPFLNNAATVLVMAPIASSFATTLGYNPEAFLMAVAIGSGCDFLTPIGHQCNLLVMSPGGYKFSDYPRLGFPLSVLIVLVAIPALLYFWPL